MERYNLYLKIAAEKQRKSANGKLITKVGKHQGTLLECINKMDEIINRKPHKKRTYNNFTIELIRE